MNAGRRPFAWIILGVAAFTWYGSLVPFEFRATSFAEATSAFGDALSARVRITSRSDAIANTMLGIPLGFAVLGLACVDRNWPRRKIAGTGLLLLPICALFAAAVEFSQLFTVGRNCSATDIVAQAFGSAVGMTGWVFWGQKLTDRVRAMWTSADMNNTGRFLIAYLVLVAFIQTLPFDASLSPYGVYRKFRDGEVKLSPFEEFEEQNDAQQWKQSAKLARLAGLFFPIGLLAARLKGRTESWGLIRVAFAAFALAACLEAMQLLVHSRTTSVTDMLVGALAVIGGWYAGRVHHEGLAIPFVASWLVVWLAGMTPVALPRPTEPRLETPRPFDWMPGALAESGDPLHSLEELLTKLVLFALLGVLIAGWWLPPRTRRGQGGSVGVAVVVAVVLGLLVSGVFEQSQRWYATHTPGLTDVLLGGVGAALGVLVASRLRASVSREPQASVKVTRG